MCSSLGVELPRLVETYSKQLADDVGMAFPDRSEIPKKIKGCEVDIKRAEDDFARNRKGAEQNSREAIKIEFEQRARTAQQVGDKNRRQLQRWFEARQRIQRPI